MITPGWRTLAFAAAVGLVVGVATALAQGWLPDGVGSLANSAGPWALSAFLVALTARSAAHAAVVGWLVLTTCELGYVVGAELRDVSSSPRTVTFWLCAALLAGPVMGVAGWWTRRCRDERRGLGAGVMAGVLLGEGVYGLTTVADTTSPPYWVVEIVVGVVVLVAVFWRRTVWRVIAAAGGASLIVGAVVLVAGRRF